MNPLQSYNKVPLSGMPKPLGLQSDDKASLSGVKSKEFNLAKWREEEIGNPETRRTEFSPEPKREEKSLGQIVRELYRKHLNVAQYWFPWEQSTDGTKECWENFAKSVSDLAIKESQAEHDRILALANQRQHKLAQEREISRKAQIELGLYKILVDAFSAIVGVEESQLAAWIARKAIPFTGDSVGLKILKDLLEEAEEDLKNWNADHGQNCGSDAIDAARAFINKL